MPKSDPILLIGAGPMAIEYSKVLTVLKKPFIVVGRSIESALEFEKQTNCPVITGGVDKYLQKLKKIPSMAIVAVSEEQLGTVTIKALQRGVKTILVEKPAGLDFKDVRRVKTVAEKVKAKVYVGYNRRFLSSIKKARKLIARDKILSISFDFTEATSRITPLKKAAGVKANWFLQNSTHVIDLAFFLSGAPQKLSAYKKDKLSWHPSGAIFTGSGITKRGVLFSYHANWKTPGRWSIEIMTKKRKYTFRPLETLQVQDWGSFATVSIELDDDYDIKFKPGVYRQTQSFLGNKKDLCTISEQVKNLLFYQQILTGKV